MNKFIQAAALSAAMFASAQQTAKKVTVETNQTIVDVFQIIHIEIIDDR